MGCSAVGAQATLFSRLLCAEVAVVETTLKMPTQNAFDGADRRLARRREHVIGRLYANEAMRQLWPDAPSVTTGSAREPVWPAGYAGSITHSRDYCAAAALRQRSYLSIGIDVEPALNLPAEVRGLVCTPTERSRIAGDTDAGQPLDRVTFSAKESVFKAWFPLTRAWLDFDEVEIQLDTARATFTALLPAAKARKCGVHAYSLTGRFAISHARIGTAVLVDASARVW